MFEAVEHPGVFLSYSWHPVGGRLYCPVCISLTKPPAPPGWNSRGGVVDHLRAIHGWKTAEREDALSAKELTEALLRWRTDTVVAGDRFGESLRLVRGVDDFLSECEV